MAIPTAIAATVAVPGLRGMPNNPMTPKQKTTGIKFGTSEISPANGEVNNKLIIINIAATIIIRESTWPPKSDSAARLIIKFSPVILNDTSGGRVLLSTSVKSPKYRFNTSESDNLWRTTTLTFR